MVLKRNPCVWLGDTTVFSLHASSDRGRACGPKGYPSSWHSVFRGVTAPTIVAIAVSKRCSAASHIPIASAYAPWTIEASICTTSARSVGAKSGANVSCDGASIFSRALCSSRPGRAGIGGGTDGGGRATIAVGAGGGTAELRRVADGFGRSEVVARRVSTSLD